MSHLRPARSLPAAALVALGTAVLGTLGAVAFTAPPAQAAPEPAKRPTVIAGGSARLSLLPPKVTDLNAMLGEQSGAPIAGALLTFASTDGAVICKARTNAKGRATCDSDNALSSVSGLQGGFTATFAGDATYLPSTGYGTVKPV